MRHRIVIGSIQGVLFLFGWGVCAAEHAGAQPRDAPGEVYYTVDHQTTLFHVDDTTRAYLHLRFREPVYVMSRVDSLWNRVQTFDGANGLVRSDQLSNVWIRVVKSTQTLYVYNGKDLVGVYPTDLGYNFFADKEKRGSMAEPDHWRTPDGAFFVTAKNENSQYHRALVLNYPNAEDAERGLKDGLITEDEYRSIVDAEHSYRMPPMSTGLGGWIEIHGDGTGKRENWTQGCIAIMNVHIDAIWDWVEVGTPVLIDP